MGPTGYGDSPYQSVSAFAGNPYFIDLEYLEKEGLLKKEDYINVDWEFDGRINYGALYNKRYPILRLACRRFIEKGEFEDFEKFEKENEWLEGMEVTFMDEERFTKKSILEKVKTAPNHLFISTRPVYLGLLAKSLKLTGIDGGGYFAFWVKKGSRKKLFGEE